MIRKLIFGGAGSTLRRFYVIQNRKINLYHFQIKSDIEATVGPTRR